MVQGFVDNDSNNPTDPAHMLMADVKKRLIELKQDEHLSNRVFRFGKLGAGWQGCAQGDCSKRKGGKLLHGFLISGSGG